MYFAIIQNTARTDNPPAAFAAHTEADLAAKVTDHMHAAYAMPKHITTLKAANAWFSGNVEDDQEFYKDGVSYDAVYWWTAAELLQRQ